MNGTPTARPAASIRRVVLRVSFVIVLLVLAIAGAAASGDAAGPAVTIEKTSTPTSVTRGYNVKYVITVTNEKTSANNVTVSDPAVGQSLPAGTTFVSASTSLGTCPAVSPSTTSITCTIGKLKANQVAKVKVVLKIPASLSGNSFTNTASTKLNEGVNDRQPQSSHADSFETSVTTDVIPANAQNEASGYFETGCDSNVVNDPSLLFTNKALGTGNVQSTEACVPDFGSGTTAFLSESPHAPGDPGFSEKSTICVPVPDSTCSSPLTFATPATFKFELSPLQLPEEFDYTTLIVFHNGVQVTAACGPGGTMPVGETACTLPPTEDGLTGVVTQIVKSLSNGTWQFGP